MSKMLIEEVLNFLPHRYPFLLIDRVLECVPGQSLTALKNVTINEPFFSGHFPGHPIMPGVLQVEAMAQATGILALRSDESLLERNAIYYLAGVDKARFRQTVVPGDQLIFNVSLTKAVRSVWKLDCEARVDDKVVASAEIMGALKEFDS